ncbi:MAG: hypothetical protein ACKO37_00115 [Vampirovibrionales bacterium]
MSSLNLPKWLPDPLSAKEGHENLINEAYDRFCEDFVQNTVMYQNKPVKFFDTPLYLDRYYQTFYHCISRDSEPPHSERIICFDRCRRIPWLKVLIEQGSELQSLVLVRGEPSTKGTKGRSRITLLWWQDNIGHQIVLEDRSWHWQLITAFNINPRSKRIEKDIFKVYPHLSNSALPSSSLECAELLLKPERHHVLGGASRNSSYNGR